MKTHAYAAQSATAPLAPFTLQRRAPGPHDVAIDILFCGVCHFPTCTRRGVSGAGDRYSRPCRATRSSAG